MRNHRKTWLISVSSLLILPTIFSLGHSVRVQAEALATGQIVNSQALSADGQTSAVESNSSESQSNLDLENSSSTSTSNDKINSIDTIVTSETSNTKSTVSDQSNIEDNDETTSGNSSIEMSGKEQDTDSSNSSTQNVEPEASDEVGMSTHSDNSSSLSNSESETETEAIVNLDEKNDNSKNVSTESPILNQVPQSSSGTDGKTGGQISTPQVKNGWQEEMGKNYYYVDGKKLFGQGYITGHWYLFDAKDGSQLIGRQYISNQKKWVLYQRKWGALGYMLYGQQFDQGHYYLFKKGSGAMQYGRINLKKYGNSKWVFYQRKTGVMLYGQQFDQGHYYLFKKTTGAMQYGFQNLKSYGNNKIVYYDTRTGIMTYGQKHIGKYYYLFQKKSGAMAHGFQNLKSYGINKVVYYDSKGHMLYGQQHIGKYWYLLKRASGARAYGLQDLSSYGANKIVYYDKSSGKMRYGYQNVGGEKVLYFKPGSGALHANSYFYSQLDPRWYNPVGCAPTSIAMVLAGYGKYVTPKNTYAVAARFGLTSTGSRGYTIVKTLQAYGYKVYPIRSLSELNRYMSKGMAVIAQVNPPYFINQGFTHALALSNYSNGRVHVNDPWGGEKSGNYSTSFVWNNRSTNSGDLNYGGAPFFAVA